MDQQGDSIQIFNGQTLWLVNTTAKTCYIGKTPTGGTSALPFTLMPLDSGAQKTGTKVVNGIHCDEWHHHRNFSAYPTVEPAQDLFWYIYNIKESSGVTYGDLAQRVRVIKPQQAYPTATTAVHDFTKSGKYTSEVPAGTFDQPKGMKCVPAPPPPPGPPSPPTPPPAPPPSGPNWCVHGAYTHSCLPCSKEGDCGHIFPGGPDQCTQKKDPACGKDIDTVVRMRVS